MGFLTILGLITALSRVFDAVTDPLIANLSDRSQNRKGRRIPFMQKAAIPLSVVTVLLFWAPKNYISGINVAWISVFILLFYLFMTMYCTPYNALISEFAKPVTTECIFQPQFRYILAGTLLPTPRLFSGMLKKRSRLQFKLSHLFYSNCSYCMYRNANSHILPQ